MSERIAASQTSVLDFQPKCRCGNHAVALLEIHAFAHCTPDTPTMASFKCHRCLSSDITRLWAILESSGPLECPNCLLTFVNLGDMLVRLSPV